MTWYVARGGVAVVTDASEAYGVSEAVAAGELSEGVSIGGELVVVDSAVEVFAAIGLAEASKAISTGGELLVGDSAVWGGGDDATEGVFG